MNPSVSSHIPLANLASILLIWRGKQIRNLPILRVQYLAIIPLKTFSLHGHVLLRSISQLIILLYFTSPSMLQNRQTFNSITESHTYYKFRTRPRTHLNFTFIIKLNIHSPPASCQFRFKIYLSCYHALLRPQSSSAAASVPSHASDLRWLVKRLW